MPRFVIPLPKQAAVNGQWDVVDLQDLYGVWLTKSIHKSETKVLQQPPSIQQKAPPLGHPLPSSAHQSSPKVEEVSGSVNEDEEHVIGGVVVTEPE